MCKSRDFLGGKLLIAAPNMGDPRFDRTVILLCAHDERHAMGVVVNKPLKNVDLADMLDQVEAERRDAFVGAPVYFGGPVGQEKGLVVHTLDYRREETIEIGPNLGLTVSRAILVDIAAGGGASEADDGHQHGADADAATADNRAAPQDETANAPSRHLLVAGHAGWGPGQLESEIAANAWAHCEADEALVFADNPSDTWQSAFARLGVTEAMFSPEWSSSRGGDTPLN
ncbi:MAG: YqgE/AlgH family protein [Pseudomonadota bacterium]